MKIGSLMTEILREQSFTYMYVMDHSHSNLNKLRHAQVKRRSVFKVGMVYTILFISQLLIEIPCRLS